MKVAKWGNSLAVRLPTSVVQAMGLKEGDDLAIRATGEAELSVEKAESTAEWLVRMRKYRGRLPADFKFDRDEANSRED